MALRSRRQWSILRSFPSLFGNPTVSRTLTSCRKPQSALSGDPAVATKSSRIWKTSRSQGLSLHHDNTLLKRWLRYDILFGAALQTPGTDKIQSLRGGRRSRYQDDEGRRTFQQASGALPVCLFVVGATIVYAHVKESHPEQLTFEGLKSYLKNLFVISAAKPLVIDEESDLKTEDKTSKVRRRDQFNFIADVVEAVQDAVVCIDVKDHSNVNWFGIPQVVSNGSGFVVKEDGLILTNAHVVAHRNRSSISVKLNDGRCFAGRVEDIDLESDLATVRINSRGLPTMKLGCSANTRIGEWVVALGSPLSLSNTVTAGVVSSTKRGASELGIQANDINYIQTDAAITFGNSGGPLVNLDEEAIGINSMRVTAGISFAIPIDHAKLFLERSAARRASGKVRTTRRYMGLTILTLTDQIRQEIETRSGVASPARGVFVWQVVVGSPAYLAGIKPGDIIVEINGEQMHTAAQVHERIKTDDKLVVRLRRAERLLGMTVVPEDIVQ